MKYINLVVLILVHFLFLQHSIISLSWRLFSACLCEQHHQQQQPANVTLCSCNGRGTDSNRGPFSRCKQQANPGNCPEFYCQASLCLSFFLHCSLTNILFQAIINFDATYTSPDDADGNFEPTNLVNVIVQQNSASAAIGGVSSGVDDDQQMLLDIEQNIANLEKSLQKGKRLSLHWIRLSLSKG